MDRGSQTESCYKHFIMTSLLLSGISFKKKLIYSDNVYTGHSLWINWFGKSTLRDALAQSLSCLISLCEHVWIILCGSELNYESRIEYLPWGQFQTLTHFSFFFGLGKSKWGSAYPDPGRQKEAESVMK